MDGSLKVRNEGNPLRCEICHQSDCLDPVTQECARCRDIPILVERLIPRNSKEEQISGLVIPFGRLRAGRAVAALIALTFSMNIIGPFGVVFLVGLYCFLTGIQRVLADTELTRRPALDLILNLSLMSAGLAGCCFSGIYLIHLISKMR